MNENKNRKIVLFRTALRRFPRGQAITELVVSMIAIVVVFLGLLTVSAFSLENVRNVISAREKADSDSRSGLQSDTNPGRMIRDWSPGGDEMMFTQDDTADTYMDGSGIFFIVETFDNEGRFAIKNEMAANSLSKLAIRDYTRTVDSPMDSVGYANMFLDAAELSSHTETTSDILSKRKLTELKRAIHSLLFNPNIELKDTVYMPARPQD